MIKLKVYIFFFSIILNTCIFSQIYVAPNGDDSNSGTIDQPLESIQKAQDLVNPGDTVYIRGGIYQVREDQISEVVQGLFSCITYLDKSGTEDKTIKYWAYPGETPIFDFTNVKPADRRVVGIYVIGSYIHIKGLEMTGIQTTITAHTESYCIYSRGNNNIYEEIVMHDNVGTGLRHYNGGGNLFLNCDSYRNWDNVSEDGKGGNNDGFGCHPSSGSTGNVFRGCRAWFNSDDGFDIIRSDEAVVFDSCWAFYNGFSTNFESLGDGNGFKAGGYAHDTADKLPNSIPRNTIKFCIAARNKANGFYSNHHLGGNDWYNNSAYQNLTNFNMLNRPSRDDADNIDGDGYDHVLKNNLSYEKGIGFKNTANIDTSKNTLETNSWQLNTSLSDADFKSIDINLLKSPRKEDGSLPDVDFMRPVQGSNIVDAGTDIGFEFLGTAPELGAIEVDYPTSIKNIEKRIPVKIALLQNYPNPFNPSTNIKFEIPKESNVKIIVYNSIGQKVSLLINNKLNAGFHETTFNASTLPSGVYFYQIIINGYSYTKQMMLLK